MREGWLGERCPKCYSDKTYETKSWEMESPRSESKVKVRQMRCRACRKGFRLYEKVV